MFLLGWAEKQQNLLERNSIVKKNVFGREKPSEKKLIIKIIIINCLDITEKKNTFYKEIKGT